MCTYYHCSDVKRNEGLLWFGENLIQVLQKNKNKEVDDTGRQILWWKTDKMHKIRGQRSHACFCNTLKSCPIAKGLYKCVMKNMVCPKCLMILIKVISWVWRRNDSCRIIQEVSQTPAKFRTIQRVPMSGGRNLHLALMWFCWKNLTNYTAIC